VVAALTVCIAVRTSPGWPRRLATLGVAVALPLVALAGMSAWRHAEPHGPLCRAQSGVHVRIGFQPGATGYYHQLADVPASPIGHVFVAHMAAELHRGQRLSDVESNRVFTGVAWDWIQDEPGAATLLVLRKLRAAFSAFEPPANDSMVVLAAHAPVLRWLPATHGVLVVLAALGLLVLLWRPSRRRVALLLLAVLAATVVPLVVTFVTWRYRLPMLVPLLLLAGLAVAELVRGALAFARTGARPPARQLVAGGVLAVLVALANHGPVDEDTLRTIDEITAQNLARSEQVAPRLAELRQLDAQPDTPARARRRAMLLTELHRHGEAYVEARRALAGQPDDVQAAGIVLRLDAWLGRADEARAVLAALPVASRQAAGRVAGTTELRWLERFAWPR
jgi:hypothetical protein